MSFAHQLVTQPRPASIRQDVELPRRQSYFPSPVDWRDAVLYFLLVDRFSDGRENERSLLDRTQLSKARPPLPNGEAWRWDRWASSGAERWQGGNLKGLLDKLDYLQHLGVNAIWLSPVFRQRVHANSYHGYGIQDFLEVDSHFGDRADLVTLIEAAHQRGIRILLDIIFNHSGANWIYPQAQWQPPYKSFPANYNFGNWLDAQDQPVPAINTADEGVWPRELQNSEHYTRAGCGDLGAGDINDPHAEHKRTDFLVLRDFNLDAANTLSDLALCYKYWIALTDCDGFRIDTLKHVSPEQARNFCGAIKEFAANLGKQNFFLIGEIAGGDYNQDRYLDVLQRNLNAALDIGEMRLALNSVAKGLQTPTAYFNGFDPGRAVMGSHRQLGEHHVSVLDDHDHVFGRKLRFTSESASDHQVTAGVALQLFSLGIPCIYYGTEQSLAGPEASERHWLPDWGNSDRYLREAMFSPRHPRRAGSDGRAAGDAGVDENLPGFGPFGTAGQHCFDEHHSSYLRIAAMTSLRAACPALRQGRQYPRPVAFLGYPFAIYGNGELMAWSRILDDEELVCILNPHGNAPRGADVLVDASLNSGGNLTVVLNTTQAALPPPQTYTGTHKTGSTLAVKQLADGTSFVEIRNLAASEIIVLSNHPVASEGGINS